MQIPQRFYTLVLFALTLGITFFSRSMPSDLAVDLEQVEGQPPAVLQVETIPDAPPYIWWEAEAPAATNFPEQNPFAPMNFGEATVLSAGEWIGANGEYPAPLFLDYDITIPEAGYYFFYSRKFWQHGPFRWRWDDGPWNTVSGSTLLLDEAVLRQHVVANWVSLGRIPLVAGPHRLRIELLRTNGPVAFDCFVLTQEPMTARGRLKPDQRYRADILGWVVFDPEVDQFAASPIDLRSLNEPFAGADGWIQAQGEALVHGDTGEPVRFWGVNVGPTVLSLDDEGLAHMARFLAKRGVNMVRFHGALTPADRLVLEPEKRDRLFALVAALKREGIYTALSFYFPLWFRFPESGGQPPFALLFFDQALQAQYRTLWHELLTPLNPHTGVSLAADPAVAMLELVNEDSFFFWTFDPERLLAPAREDLERQFAAWLQRSYGSLEAALAAWNAPEAVRPAVDRMALLSAGAIAAQPQNRRNQDTAAFLTDVQVQFFGSMTRHLKHDLGYRGLVIASNWITADARRLGPLDKFTNTVADVMDRHGYFSGRHEGPTASYALAPGDPYQDRSALLLENPQRPDARPLSLPIMDLRYNRKPSTISEVNWAMPNRFRADFPVLAAAYGSLQETDGFFFFATNRLEWDPSLGKFSIASPTVMGQFPATALMYRKGLLQPGDDVVTLERNLAELRQLQGVPVVAPQNLDALRAEEVPATPTPALNPLEAIDPLAFFVGKVNLILSSENNRSETVDLAPYRDRQQRRIQSSTRELLWDYDDGLLTIDAPQVKGATGFLQHAGSLRLGPLTINSAMEYGSVLLVALDDQPLAQSQEMLLQVMSAEENFGWRTDGTVEKLMLSTGTAPLVIQQLQGQITLHRADANRLLVTALDANGIPQDVIGSGSRWELRPDVFYYWISQRP